AACASIKPAPVLQDTAWTREMARPEGFEPPTNGFGSHYSIRLSYGRLAKILRGWPDRMNPITVAPRGAGILSANARLRAAAAAPEPHFAPSGRESTNHRPPIGQNLSLDYELRTLRNPRRRPVEGAPVAV